LGVAVSAVAIDGEKLRLDDWRLASGFHAPEADWRWTDGTALLSVGKGRKLRVEVAAVSVRPLTTNSEYLQPPG
jgi:hypothetical protein